MNDLMKELLAATEVKQLEEEKETEFKAYMLDELIKHLQEIKKDHGNLQLAVKTPGGKWTSEGGVDLTVGRLGSKNVLFVE